MTGPDPTWGPVASGGPGRRWPRRLLVAVAAAVTTSLVGVLAASTFVLLGVENNRETVAIDAIEERLAGEPLNVLVVGSDARDDLTPEQRRELSLGDDFEGQRADTNILISISADRSVINVVSVPRDLVVTDQDGGIAKLTETYMLGRPELVRAIVEDVGLPVNHYVEVSVTGFLDTVEAFGGVRLCLDEPLFDRNSGADFEAGCQQFTPQQALAYVRSRVGTTGDFERIQRQQQFMRALVAQVVDASLLVQPARLRSVGEQLSDSVVTDDGLGVETALGLAQDLQRLAQGDIPMVTVPSYPQDLRDGGVVKNFVVPYGPGLAALVEAVRAGEPLPARGTAEERAEVDVLLWSGGRLGEAGVVESTLLYGGFRTVGAPTGELDAGDETVVYALPGATVEAGWVAAHLGAEVLPMPADLVPDVDVDVVVAVGDDAGVPVGAARLAAEAR